MYLFGALISLPDRVLSGAGCAAGAGLAGLWLIMGRVAPGLVGASAAGGGTWVDGAISVVLAGAVELLVDLRLNTLGLCRVDGGSEWVVGRFGLRWRLLRT